MAEILRSEGYDVVEHECGEDALGNFGNQRVDCVLVDLMLPGIDGFDTCRALRKMSDVPIIVVTARTDDFDVVAGLEAGADDYVTKPFEPKVLLARIRALLRRARGIDAGSSSITLGDRVEVTPDEGRVLVEGEEVHLTKTEFRLLCELGSSRGGVLWGEQLLDSVWGYDYFGET
jgi:DNA-binding response OmpR family regulator